MNCQHCHQPLDRDAHFCPHCGTLIPTHKDQAEDNIKRDNYTNINMPVYKDNEQPAQEAELPTITSLDKKELTEQKTTDSKEPETPEAEQIESDLSQRIATLPTVTFQMDQPEPGTKEEDKTQISPDRADLTTFNDPTIPVPLESIAHPELVGPQASPPLRLSQLSPSEPLLQYQLNTTTKGSQMFPAVVNPESQTRSKGRRRNPVGCTLGCLTTLILLLVILGAVWLLVLRPYMHNIAANKIDHALNQATSKPLPPQIQLLPPNSIIPVQENVINNLIVLNLAPSDPVQNPNTTVNSQRVRLDFQLYGYPSAVTMIPKVTDGHIVADNVTTEGLFSLIMSPDEMRDILNKHLAVMQNNVGRTITAVHLKNQEVDITVG